MNSSGKSREKLVYSARHFTEGSRSDLQSHLGVTVMEFLETAQWAYNRQIQIGIRGFAEKRYSTLERFLKRMSAKGELRSTYWNHKTKVYAKKMKTRGFDLTDAAKIYHGLCCTECLIRFMTAKEGEPIPERLFRGYGRVPEFGIRYENGKLLLLEFSTKHDVTHTGKIHGKLIGYDDYLREIERDFDASCVVVFVLDVPRDRVKGLVDRYRPNGPYVFSDYSTFLEVPMGQNLISPTWIYPDGTEDSL
jgi:hypothetical protein